jgi:phosphoesterase RecJ-like protein
MASVSDTRWHEILNVLLAARRVAISTHIHPDGDALGSQMALAGLLRLRGIEVTPVLSDAVPANLKFLDPDQEIRTAGDPRVDAALQAADVIVVLDVSKSDRLGKLMNPILAAPGRRVCVDHHTDGDFPASPSLIDPRASSTGELIYELSRHLLGDQPLPPRVALALYVAIMTDTGGFRFSNTEPRTHRIAAELLEAGVSPELAHQEVFHKAKPETLRLLGLALSSLQVELEGRLAWLELTQELFERTGARPEDVDGFVELPRTLVGVEVVALFMQLASGRVKVSLRSSAGRNVQKIAAQFGGGGHVHAAGVLMPGPWPGARDSVLAALRESLGASS